MAVEDPERSVTDALLDALARHAGSKRQLGKELCAYDTDGIQGADGWRRDIYRLLEGKTVRAEKAKVFAACLGLPPERFTRPPPASTFAEQIRTARRRQEELARTAELQQEILDELVLRLELVERRLDSTGT